MNSFFNEHKYIALFAASALVVTAIVISYSGLYLVQNRVITENQASENVRKKVTCSWKVTNTNNNIYGLEYFNAEVSVLIKEGIVWNTITSLTVDADYNASPSFPDQGTITFPNITIGDHEEYKCSVRLRVKNEQKSEIGQDVCTPPFQSAPFLYIIPGETSVPRIPTKLPTPSFTPSPTPVNFQSPGCIDAQLSCPEETYNNPGLIDGRLFYKDPAFQCGKIDFDNGKITTKCSELSSDGFSVRYHQIKSEDINIQDENASSTIYIPKIQGVQPNNQTCSCNMKITVPLCKETRTLNASDGYENNQCNSNCNFIFQNPSPDSCLALDDNKLRIRLTYSRGGSLDFDDDFNSNSKIFFTDITNALRFEYVYKTPGVYDVTLTCHETPAGQTSCTKRVYVTGKKADTSFVQDPEPEPTAPVCISEKPDIGVGMEIESCQNCN